MYPWLTLYDEQLQQLHASGRLPHALMLIGDEGVGVAELTTSLAANYLCHSPIEGKACGRCHSCRLLSQSAHPDLLQKGLEEKSIGVDLVRESIARLVQTPQLGVGKVVVIHHAEKMTEAASNALLKTLEEPSGKALILLTVSSASRLLPTIRSRCQQWVIHPQAALLEPWLMEQTHDASLTKHLLRLFPNQPLNALAFYQNQSAKEQRIFFEQLKQAIEQPWLIPEFSKSMVSSLSEKQLLLMRLLIDVAKYQQGIAISDLVFSQESELIQALAQKPSETIFEAIDALTAMRSDVAEMPSSTPSLLMTEWMIRFFDQGITRVS